MNGLVTRRTTPIEWFLGTSSSVTVLSLTVPASGEYLVQATATGSTSASFFGFFRCRAMGVTSGGSSYSATPFGYGPKSRMLGTMAENGAVFGKAGGTIQERCYMNGGSASTYAKVYSAAMTAEQVSSLNGAKATKPAHLKPVNKFVPPPKAQPARP